MTSRYLSIGIVPSRPNLDTKDQSVVLPTFGEKTKCEAQNATIPLQQGFDASTMLKTREKLSESSTSSCMIQKKDIFSMDKAEVDTREQSPVQRGIHTSLTCPELIPVPAPASASVVSSSSVSASEHSPLVFGSVTTKSSSKSKSKLTLSAFRRPEQSIRLTKSNPNRRLSAEYDLHAPGCRILGHGAFSTVRLAVRKCDRTQVAVKTIAKHEALRSRRLRIGGRQEAEEWEILRRLQNHPYIINLLDVFETDDEIQLVMEYAPGGELYDAIQKKRNQYGNSLTKGGRFSEAEACHITSQILRALVDLHSLGIVHRDVKAENILIASNESADDKPLHVKLCDFGVARAVHRSSGVGSSSDSESSGNSSPITPHQGRQGLSRSYSIVGSDYYMAPEIEHGASYCTSMDIYSLGVTLYILLCGFPPVFTGEEGHSEVMFPHTFWKDISEEAKNLVKKMLNPDPSSRISAREALSDPWIVRNIVTSAKRSRRGSLECTAKLELVRNCLYKNLCREAVNKRVSSSQKVMAAAHRRKRPRRTSSCLMALADLYREVATPADIQPTTAPAATTTTSVSGACEPIKHTVTVVSNGTFLPGPTFSDVKNKSTALAGPPILSV